MAPRLPSPLGTQNKIEEEPIKQLWSFNDKPKLTNDKSFNNSGHRAGNASNDLDQEILQKLSSQNKQQSTIKHVFSPQQDTNIKNKKIYQSIERIYGLSDGSMVAVLGSDNMEGQHKNSALHLPKSLFDDITPPREQMDTEKSQVLINRMTSIPNKRKDVYDRIKALTGDFLLSQKEAELEIARQQDLASKKELETYKSKAEEVIKAAKQELVDGTAVLKGKISALEGQVEEETQKAKVVTSKLDEEKNRAGELESKLKMSEQKVQSYLQEETKRSVYKANLNVQIKQTQSENEELKKQLEEAKEQLEAAMKKPETVDASTGPDSTNTADMGTGPMEDPDTAQKQREHEGQLRAKEEEITLLREQLEAAMKKPETVDASTGTESTNTAETGTGPMEDPDTAQKQRELEEQLSDKDKEITLLRAQLEAKNAKLKDISKDLEKPATANAGISTEPNKPTTADAGTDPDTVGEKAEELLLEPAAVDVPTDPKPEGFTVNPEEDHPQNGKNPVIEEGGEPPNDEAKNKPVMGIPIGKDESPHSPGAEVNDQGDGKNNPGVQVKGSSLNPSSGPVVEISHGVASGVPKVATKNEADEEKDDDTKNDTENDAGCVILDRKESTTPSYSGFFLKLLESAFNNTGIAAFFTALRMMKDIDKIYEETNKTYKRILAKSKRKAKDPYTERKAKRPDSATNGGAEGPPTGKNDSTVENAKEVVSASNGQRNGSEMIPPNPNNTVPPRDFTPQADYKNETSQPLPGNTPTPTEKSSLSDTPKNSPQASSTDESPQTKHQTMSRP